ncbi:hypothetical protein AVEN_41260-1 [Araneus ventricosus]|uniref:Uncharacterized protein n=1 Tax=Araneus ventricosus TaxID=182803 RepID=A0A4Y2LPD1_ARAVE|nr:hypothetical protein AVEN_41260-1 [Araneus ventricosus]
MPIPFESSTCSMPIPFESSTCSMRVIARSTVPRRVSRTIAATWRVMLAFNPGRVTGIQDRRTRRPGSWKTSLNYPIIPKVGKKQCLHWSGSVRWRTIRHALNMRLTRIEWALNVCCD